MTNEIEQYAPAELVTASQADSSDRALDRIEKQARAMVAAHKLGSALAATDMVPKDYKGKPDNATAAILFGAELDLSAIQSLQNIFIIHGKPAMYARTMVALVIKAGHRLTEVEATPESVTWKGVRRDNGEEFTSTWTIDRATKAGFLTNDLYKKQPTEMLRAKCQTELCRTMAPDVLLGMSFSVEDLELEQRPIQATSERVPAGPKRGTAGLAERLGVASTPEPEKASEPEPEAPAAPAMATNAQLKKLNILLANEKLDTREQKLEWLEGQFGRKFASSAELTKAETTPLIEFLEKAQAEDATKAPQ